MRSLRVVAEIGRAARRQETFIVYGDRRIGFGDFVRRRQLASATPSRDDSGVGHGDRVAVLSANNPEWCLTFWGTVDIGADPRRAQRLVEDRRDHLRPRRTPAPRCSSPTRKRFERIADHLDEMPDLERVFLIDADPADFGGDRAPSCTASTSSLASPTDEFPDAPIDEDDPAVIFYTSGTTGRPKGAISTHRNMIANLQNTMLHTVAGVDGRRRRRRRAAGTRRRPDRRAVHVAAVPRVGLPLDPRGRHAGRAASS